MKKLLTLTIALLLPLIACAATPADEGAPEDDTTANADDGQTVLPGTEESEAVGSTSEAATYKCGVNLVTKCTGGRNPGCFVYVFYRHCTSGNDSIKVKAEVSFYPDGKCVWVGPHKTELIHVYGVPPGVFKRIRRCS